MRVVIAVQAEGADRELAGALVDYGVDWDVEWTADAGAAAAVRDADVVVADAHAPGGIDLLQQVRLGNPKAVRILVLDEDGNDAPGALRALENTHRFLRRPLSADEIVSAVESVIELHQMLDSTDLREAIGRIGALPPPPRLYLELHRKLEDPRATTAAISALIAQDPATAAKVLRLCNSAYFAFGRKVTDIRSAVVRLGQDAIRRVVLAGEVFALSAPEGIDRDALSRRAMVASRLAARLLDGPSADLAATAAVVAEVGMLLPGVRIPEEPALAKTRGPHYAEAGAYLLGLWGLPMPIVEAVANQRQPRRSRFRGFWVGGAVHVATSLAAGYPLDEAYLESLGLTGRVPMWKEMAEAIRASGI
ncbi:HDOD domain-containing protein [Coralloluteibacterium thermophilus]|uniref:HDOD domain-containing protein n=1 Tax=Coralloluteibacterium thermophilum TaxID=2707049 RepID=A0ABV9NFN5_9GAMM